MGSAQSLPIVGEAVTAVEAGSKTIAAGACALVGQHKAADELLDGAKQSLEHYTDVSCLVANSRMLVAQIQGDHKMVEHLKETQAEAWTDLGENTPVVGHGIGIYHYCTGDREAGDRVLIKATRSSAVIVATAVTGGAGAVICAGAAAGSGLAIDGAFTLANSADHHEYAPVGFLAAVKHAGDTGSANDIFDAAAIPVLDGAGGAMKGAATRSRVPTKGLPARQTAGRPSLPETYQALGERPNMLAQVPYAEVEGRGVIRSFANARDAAMDLERNQSYDFVRLKDGSFRFISHTDRTRISGQSGTLVGHTSLVGTQEAVVAAGEMHLDAHGFTNINPQSGHFQFPLKLISKQVGRAFPPQVIVFDAPTMISLVAGTTLKAAKTLPIIKLAAVYTLSLVVIITNGDSQVDSKTPLADSTRVVAWYENGAVRVLAFSNPVCAREAFDSISGVDRVLCKREPFQVLELFNERGRADECTRTAQTINTVFPGGNWRELCKDVETWQDVKTGRYHLRCTSLVQGWTGNVEEVVFEKDDELHVRQGKFVIERKGGSVVL